MRALIRKILPKWATEKIDDRLRRIRNRKRFVEHDQKNPGFYSSIAPLDFYKCIFIHIPKNAGMSVCYALFGNHAGSHRRLRDYYNVFPESTIREYYKFAFVRNPWDRLVSTYVFLKKGGMTDKDKAWADANLSEYDDFGTFVRKWINPENIYTYIHFIPQFEFVIDKNGESGVDFVGRFENLNRDFETVAQQLGIESELKKVNSSRKDSEYRSFYDDETREIVAKVYARDIEMFNYEF